MSVSTPQRRVRRLQLRAPSRDAATHASVLLEDALRIASWPGAEGSRLVLVRRLDLGRIPAGGSSASLALQLERRCREVPVEFITEASELIRAEGAVVFTSRAAAVALLARRWGKGQAATEWFWPLAVPGWRAGLPRTEGWRLLLQVALTEEAAAVVAAEVVSAVADTGRWVELVAAIPENEVSSLMAACQWVSPAEHLSQTDAEPWPFFADTVNSRAEFIPEDLKLAVGRQLAEVRAPRVLMAWLAAVLLVRRRPALAALNTLPHWAHRILPSIPRQIGPPPGVAIQAGKPQAERSPPVKSRRPATAILPSDQTSPAAPQVETPRRPDSEEIPNEVGVLPTRPDAISTEASATSPPPIESARPLSRGESMTGDFTACGGLLFIIPVLVRLGFPDWLNEHPERLGTDFPTTLLLAFGRQVKLRGDDPLVLALNLSSLDAAEAEPSSVDRSGTPSTDSISAAAAIVSEADPKATESYWIRAVRRWCRLEARVGLASLIRRPARVRFSRTHLELIFELSQIDLRIRRAGLDLDPGWVPWLGRVIRFHYLNPDDHDG